jgi:Flp pilus assembly pilin Flp
MQKFSARKRSQAGVTMIEYALIAALIAVVAVVALTSIGTYNIFMHRN